RGLASRPRSAAATDCRRTLLRPPAKRRTALRVAPFFLAHAKHTIPTGFSGVPPAGPATPVTAIASCARLRFKAPEAISLAVCSLTAPWRDRVDPRTPSSSFFEAFE